MKTDPHLIHVMLETLRDQRKIEYSIVPGGGPNARSLDDMITCVLDLVRDVIMGHAVCEINPENMELMDTGEDVEWTFLGGTPVLEHYHELVKILEIYSGLEVRWPDEKGQSCVFKLALEPLR